MKKLSELRHWQIFNKGQKLYRAAQDTQCGNPPFITVNITDCCYDEQSESWMLELELFSLGFHDEIMADRLTTLPSEIQNRTTDIIKRGITISVNDIRDNSHYRPEAEKCGIYTPGTYFWLGCGWMTSKEEAQQFATRCLKGESFNIESDINKALNKLLELEKYISSRNGWLQLMKDRAKTFGMNEDEFYENFPEYKEDRTTPVLDSDGKQKHSSRFIKNTSYECDVENRIKRVYENYAKFRKQSYLFDKEPE